ncbi:unnamed protein product (mitochondrion) [Plasmodiophora brassicae]|uniref:Protein kinase domain-containing protein n=2 Tax=Plasmodiophora brassicae TaxID=37360 RepID=A0A3P3YAI9_PLABS|nr:unnamed protein product [Plasmodiophora brassicae]
MPPRGQYIVLRAILFAALACLVRSRFPRPAPGSASRSGLGECRKEDFMEIGVIGTGETGVVFLARHPATQEVFAVKRIPRSLMQPSNSVANEPRLLESLQGVPFVVKLFCTMSDSDNVYLVMEFCQGGEMFERVVKYDGLREQDAKYYAASIVLALEQMHERGIVYRDLKLQNVLLTATGHIRLADVGLGKEVGAGGRAGSFVGTADYMAPEMFNVLKGKDYVAHPVDWWALGVVIHEMLLAVSPFRFPSGTFPHHWEEIILNRDIPMGQVDVSDAAERIIRELLHKTPESRLGFNGADDVKRHDWFADIDWNALAQGRVPPPAPPAELPPLVGLTDLSRFDMEWVEGNLNAPGRQYTEF